MRSPAPYGDLSAFAWSASRQPLAKVGEAGIATCVMRQREYLVVIRAETGLPTLHTFHWADEIRDPRTEIATR